ncbi:MAG: CPBP family intramembrane metalloprotease [Candidatus Aminicenantes bacterium]|nr:CPBP family intramembrane metalloprotease [Candidatus Aminicenantes bacterium]
MKTKHIIKALWVSLIIYLVAITGFNFLFRDMFPAVRSFADGLFVYLIRLTVLFSGVVIFYTGNVPKIFPFLGFKKKFMKPFLSGLAASLPFILSWIIGCVIYKVPIHFSWNSIVMIFLALIGPGLFEEGLFRGVLFNRLSSATKWYTAALITGLFFGPAHLANLIIGHNINEIMISVTAGLVMSFPFGFIFYKTKGNLWACISYHFFIAGSMDAVIKEEMIKAHLNEITIITSIGLILSLILVFIVFSREKFVRFASG